MKTIQEKQHEWYLKNRDRILESRKKYREENKEKIKQQQIEYYEKFPWAKSLSEAKQRCTNPNNNRYEYYGDKGIEFHLTFDDGEFMWFRDKAYLMKWPTIDRKDKNKHYILNNCQFIEHFINTGKDRHKPILQYDLDGKFIKEWESATEAQKKLKISNKAIFNCLKGKCKTSGGFIWKYKEMNNE